jgi:hypothetical protein
MAWHSAVYEPFSRPKREAAVGISALQSGRARFAVFRGRADRASGFLYEGTNNPADKMTSAVEIVMKLLCIGSSWLKGLGIVRCNIADDLNPSCLQQPYVNARR